VTRIGELGTLAVTSNRSTLLILVALMMEAIPSSKMSVLQQPNGITSQKMAFFVVTAVKISNLT
jgi:hypothetical protein